MFAKVLQDYSIPQNPVIPHQDGMCWREGLSWFEHSRLAEKYDARYMCTEVADIVEQVGNFVTALCQLGDFSGFWSV